MFLELEIIGRLGGDPELRYTPNGQAVCNFSVATSRKYKNSNSQLVEETIWVKVTTWGDQAENHNKYLKRGSLVRCVGRLNANHKGEPRTWQDRNGEWRATYEMTAHAVLYLNSKSDNDEKQQQVASTSSLQQYQSQSSSSNPMEEDEIPF